ncbi:MAG: hypothetical protein ABIH83_03965 [Candidatus Micrarchaeota archaeon]
MGNSDFGNGKKVGNFEIKNKIGDMVAGIGKKAGNKLLFAGIALILILFAGMGHADIFGWLIPDIAMPEFWQADNQGIVVEPDYGWIVTSLLGMLCFAMFGTVGYMMGEFLGAKVKAWCKQLLMNVVKCAIVLVIVSGAFVFVNEAPDSLVGVGFFQIDNAINFAETVRNTIIYEFITLTTITAILSSIGNITPYLRPAGMIGISFSLAPAFRPIFDSLGIMLSSLAVAIGAWYLQIWVLVFTQTKLFGIFVPIGLFLRSFGMDRPGNALLAIAIGFYFVFPFVLNLNAIALENYLAAQYMGGEIYQTGDNQLYGRGEYGACMDHTNAQGQSIACFFRLALVGPLRYITTYITDFGYEGLVLFGLLQLLTGSLASSLVFGFLAVFMSVLLATTVYYVLIVSILMPLFNMFITLTVIKELTKFLGTEIDLSAFEKIF